MARLTIACGPQSSPEGSSQTSHNMFSWLSLPFRLVEFAAEDVFGSILPRLAELALHIPP